METTLTMEQSAELVGFGVPQEKASLQVPVDAPYRTSGIRLAPVFSIGDLLAILPKEIEIIGMVHSLGVMWNSAANPKEWNVHYVHDIHVIHTRNSELVDALYQMIGLIIERKYVKPQEL